MARNVSRAAARDLQKILKGSLAFGPDQAQKMADKMETCFARIARGDCQGHKRADITFSQPTLAFTIKPFIIFYNPETRLVLRIVDGRRDLPALFAGDPRGDPSE